MNIRRKTRLLNYEINGVSVRLIYEKIRKINRLSVGFCNKSSNKIKVKLKSICVFAGFIV